MVWRLLFRAADDAPLVAELLSTMDTLAAYLQKQEGPACWVFCGVQGVLESLRGLLKCLRVSISRIEVAVIFEVHKSVSLAILLDEMLHACCCMPALCKKAYFVLRRVPLGSSQSICGCVPELADTYISVCIYIYIYVCIYIYMCD